jgi:hypothetical protein
MVSESVKKVLNEISSDVAFRAYDKAEKAGRTNQSKTFYDYGVNQLKNEIGDNQNIRGINNKWIHFLNTGGRNIFIYANGLIDAAGGGGKIDNYDNWDQGLKNSIKTNKETARIIVKWINKFIVGSGADINPELLDWHFWAYL